MLDGVLTKQNKPTSVHVSKKQGAVIIHWYNTSQQVWQTAATEWMEWVGCVGLNTADILYNSFLMQHKTILLEVATF